MKIIPPAAALFFSICLGAQALPPAAGEKAGGGKAERKAGPPASRRASPGLREACKADLDKFCKGVKSGSKKAKCLNRRQKELSAACKTALKTLPPEPKNMNKAGAVLSNDCRADAEKFCAGIESDLKKGKCLKNEVALSAGCKKALQDLPPPEQENSPDKGEAGRQQAEDAMKKDCAGDIKKFCGDAGPGLKQGNCLMEHENDLSSGCLNTLKSLPPPGQEGGPEGRRP